MKDAPDRLGNSSAVPQSSFPPASAAAAVPASDSPALARAAPVRRASAAAGVSLRSACAARADKPHVLVSPEISATTILFKVI